MRRFLRSGSFITSIILFSTTLHGAPKRIQVTVENISPGPALLNGGAAYPSNGGVWVMRPWVGFHDGTFRNFSLGAAASSGVEHEAEDGFVGDLFNTTIPPDGLAAYGNNGTGQRQYQLFPSQPGAGPVQGSFSGPLAPGLTASRTFTVESADPRSQYLSYMAMIIPSNDAFFGNEDPKAIKLFDENGNFAGPITIVIKGSDILDAGTEVNTEIPADTAFLGQSVANTGTPENGVVHLHPGFEHPASGGILKGTVTFPPGGPSYSFANADFKIPAYEVARITISEVPPVPPRQIRVTVKNISPGPTLLNGTSPSPTDGGVWVMRPWVGFHDGTYANFALGAAASSGVEHEAEDGFVGDLFNTTIPPDGVSSYGNNGTGQRQYQLFPTQPGSGPVQGSFSGPLAPGLTASRTFTVDPNDPRSQYLSYMAMIIPSNDAFFGNENPRAIKLFDGNGNFAGPISITIRGSDILDAGTEANTEAPADTAFLGQAVADTGTPENGVVHVHPGFEHPASGGILKGTVTFPPGGPSYTFQNADFKLANYEIATVTIEEVPPAPQRRIQVTVENVSPGPARLGGASASPSDGGVWVMRPWVGFHDGTYVNFALGAPASSGVEHEAEDGFVGDLFNTTIPPDGVAPYGNNGTGQRQYQLFPTQPGSGPVQGSFSGPLAPGLTASRTFTVDPNDPRSQYLSYMAMIIPSNDAFFGNENPRAIKLFDGDGNFAGPISISVKGSDILDAGTEVNTEIPGDTAFLGQAVANTGTPENGVVHVHPGFEDPESGGILKGTVTFPPGGPSYTFENADFKLANYEVAKITIAEVPPQPPSYIQVAVQNISPGATISGGAAPSPTNGGVWVMRPWVGFHDGTYRTFELGAPASSGVEHEAEDGFVGDLANTTIPPDGTAPYGNNGTGERQFQLFPHQPGSGPVQGSFSGPLAPGLTAARTFRVDPNDPTSQYLSYMAMIIPSNDAFFGNENPRAIKLFDGNGRFLGPISITVKGSEILDAGTEVNTEIPGDTAFLGQAVANTGTPENGVVHVHPGFEHPASGGILKGTVIFPPGGPSYTFENADFKLASYEVAVIAISELPALDLKRAGSSITLSWSASGYELEMSPSLPSANWTPVQGVSNNSVTVQLGPKAGFYRLRKP